MNLANLQLTKVREYTETILPLDFIYMDQEVTEQKELQRNERICEKAILHFSVSPTHTKQCLEHAAPRSAPHRRKVSENHDIGHATDRVLRIVKIFNKYYNMHLGTATIITRREC